MSYILEALKKAEAERERSHVPGLSTAQGNSTIYITHQSNARAWWIAGGLAVLLVAVVGAWALRSAGGSAEGSQAVASAPPTAPVAATPAPAATAAAIAAPPPAPAPVATPAPLKPPSAKELSRVSVAPVVVATAPSTKPEPLKAPALAAAPVSAAVPAPAPVAVAAAPVVAEPSAKPAPATARPAGSAVPAFSELPDAVRKQIPALHISGAVYSDSPPEWALIINDQVLTRGSQVTPDVRLEEVTASSAVFNFKGQRFRMDR